MIYSYKEVLQKYGSRYNIEKALKNKEIYRLDKDIYSEKSFINPLILYSKKYPYAVITMDSAFYYYNLTDVIPNKIYLATPRNARIIKNQEIEQIFMDKSILDVGKSTVKVNNEDVYMYDKERLLIELIRKRKQIPFDYYKEIIANYREIVDDLDMYKIEQYLSLFKNDLNLSEALQREVF